MKRFFYIISAMTAIANSAMAQQDTISKTEIDTTIERSIDVVKAYNPVIREAGKVNTMPELKDVDTKKIKTEYSIWTLPTTPVREVIPTLNYAEARNPETQDVKEGFVRLGGGNYSSFNGEIYTPIYKDGAYLIDIYGKHNSSFGDITLSKEMYPSLSNEYDADALLNDNKAKVSFLKGMRKSELSAFAGFSYNRFNYYGYHSFTDSLVNDGKNLLPEDYEKQSFISAEANIRFKTKQFVSNFKYDVQTNYQLFHTKNNLNEHTIYTNLNGVYRMETSQLGINIDLYNIFMSRPDSTELYNFNASDNLHSYSVLKINPSYKFEGKSGMMFIGVKGIFSMGQGRPGSIMPDIYGSIEIIDKKWYVYAGVTGDYVVNSLRNTRLDNRYISPDERLEDTYVPIDIYAGSKIKIFNRVAIDMNIGYKVINNPYFFVNKEIKDTLAISPYFNTFDVVYSKDAGLFTAGLGMKYNWKDKVDFAVKMKYNKWALEKGETPWMQPKCEFTATTSYCPTDYWRFCIAYHMSTGRKALVLGQTENMKNVYDLNFAANYKVLSFMDLFLNFNNILSQEYEIWHGYTAQRFNIMGGLSLTF